ncbi:hypothetical protein FVE85_5896 [Porphyridium purpureum]|uniref:V-SNARE coiled-coil homology domain-containing protein n=1 Tax=Porphyridium purpureum TaxID=35688 RepID=A0A5J4Z360_PORPP|nr:hypothetical protein FVE85_5896 [Porphyridium purpureum]|eukprot:POR0452..scf295_1
MSTDGPAHARSGESAAELEAYSDRLTCQLVRLGEAGATPDAIQAVRDELERIEDLLLEVQVTSRDADGRHDQHKQALVPGPELHVRSRSSEDADSFQDLLQSDASTTPPPSSSDEIEAVAVAQRIEEAAARARSHGAPRPQASGETTRDQNADKGASSAGPYKDANLQARLNETLARAHERGEKLDKLDEKSAAMFAEAQDFHSSATKLRKKMQKQSMKLF